MIIPKNEFGVVVLFSQLCESKGIEIVSIQAKYPDAIIKRTSTGETYRAEFEFMASNFLAHRHNPVGCDLIICWKQDFVFPLSVWQLCNWTNTDVAHFSNEEKENFFLKRENKILQKIIDKTPRENEIKIINTSWRTFRPAIDVDEVEEIACMSILQIRNTYNVSERTAWNWREYAKSEVNQKQQ